MLPSFPPTKPPTLLSSSIESVAVTDPVAKDSVMLPIRSLESVAGTLAPAKPPTSNGVTAEVTTTLPLACPCEIGAIFSPIRPPTRPCVASIAPPVAVTVTSPEACTLLIGSVAAEFSEDPIRPPTTGAPPLSTVTLPLAEESRIDTLASPTSPPALTSSSPVMTTSMSTAAWELLIASVLSPRPTSPPTWVMPWPVTLIVPVAVLSETRPRSLPTIPPMERSLVPLVPPLAAMEPLKVPPEIVPSKR